MGRDDEVGRPAGRLLLTHGYRRGRRRGRHHRPCHRCDAGRARERRARSWSSTSTRPGRARWPSGTARGRASAGALDIRDRDAAVAALDGADVLLNTASYRVNLDAMEVALAAGAHYVDLGGLFHVTREQLGLDARFREAGLLAVLGMGSTPGKTNVMAARAVELLGDDVERIVVGAAGRDPDPPAGPLVAPVRDRDDPRRAVDADAGRARRRGRVPRAADRRGHGRVRPAGRSGADDLHDPLRAGHVRRELRRARTSASSCR